MSKDNSVTRVLISTVLILLACNAEKSYAINKNTCELSGIQTVFGSSATPIVLSDVAVNTVIQAGSYTLNSHCRQGGSWNKYYRYYLHTFATNSTAIAGTSIVPSDTPGIGIAIRGTEGYVGQDNHQLVAVGTSVGTTNHESNFSNTISVALVITGSNVPRGEYDIKLNNQLYVTATNNTVSYDDNGNIPYSITPSPATLGDLTFHVINAPKCKITNPTESKALPTSRIADIKAGTTPWTPFRINLNDCGAGRTFKLKYIDAHNAANNSSILENTDTSSDGAKNVGIQLRGHDGQPVTLGSDISQTITQTDGSMDINYAARIAGNGGEPTAGTVQSTAYFDLTYP